ncbi:MAG: AAA family ATPase [bacterium]
MNEMNRVNNHYRESDEDRPIDIHDLWNKFFRRRRLFLYIAIPIFLGIVISQLTKAYTPIYRAAFDIGVTQERSTGGFLAGYEEIVPTTQIGTVTQRVISNLLSVNLAEKVVDSLGLYAHIKNHNPAVIKLRAEIKKDFKKPIGPLRLKIEACPASAIGSHGEQAEAWDGRFEIFNNGERLKQGRMNETVDFEFFDLKIVPLTEITGRKTYELTIYPRDRMAIALRNSISTKVLEADKIDKEIGSSGVPFSGEGASEKLVTANPRVYDTDIGILRISVHWGNPDDALSIAQVLAAQMIEQDKTEKSLQYVQSQTFIDTQLTVYQEKLTTLEDEIRSFKQRKKIVDLKASTHALITQISYLESQKSQKQIEQKILKDLNTYLTSEKGSIDQVPNFASAMVSDPVLQNFYSQLLQVEAALKGKLKEYSSGHPKVLEIKAKLAGLKDQMKIEITKRIPTMHAEIRSIDNQIGSLQMKLETVPDDEIQLARLERDKETAEKLYTFFAEKLEETRVQEASVTSNLRIINPPLVSTKPVTSRGRLKAGFIALLISLLAGGFGVFIAEYLDNTVKDPDIVSEKIGLPIFASIPNVDAPTAEGKEQRAKSKDQSAKRGEHSAKSNESVKKRYALSPMLYAHKLKNLLFSIAPLSDSVRNGRLSDRITAIDPQTYSAEFEAFRKLSVNLEFAHPEERYKVIYITSTGPDEGKTFISLNLGLTLGTSNKKVIAIDTDFRKKRGRLTDIAGLKKKPGLFDVLQAKSKLKDVITEFTPQDGLHSSSDAVRSTPDALRSSSDALPTTPYALRLLPVGAIPPNPFTFLDSVNMQELIAELKSNYDYILIDGVPLVLFADASYLANFSDGVFLTARYGKTNFKELEYARDMLLTSKSNIIGIIMNGVPKTREGYYYYHHYYYHKYYPKYYRKEE